MTDANPNSPDVERWRLLIERCGDGVASPAEREELDRILAAHPAAADLWVERARLEASLRQILGQVPLQTRVETLLNDPAPAALPDAGTRVFVPFAAKPPRRIVAGGEWWDRAKWPAAIVAVACATFLLSLLRPADNDHSPRILSGTLSSEGKPLHNVPAGVLLQAGPDPVVIAWKKGPRIELAAGAEIVWPGGGMDGRTELQLARGAATVQCPTKTAGLRIATPAGTIATGHADFTLEVIPPAATGSSRTGLQLAVKVLTGTVEVEFAGVRHQLTAGESRTFGA